jgi:hypothetical protein
MDLNTIDPDSFLYILEKLPYCEKVRLQCINKEWKAFLSYLINKTKSKEISQTLQFQVLMDPNYRGRNPEYMWYLCPKNYNENLCIKTGWKILEYDILAKSKEPGFDENDKFKRSKYALEKAVQNKYVENLLINLKIQFVKERLKKFNRMFKTNLTEELFEDIPIALVEQNNKGEMFLEFTLNDADTYIPHDYKLSYVIQDQTNEFVWQGIGDDWKYKSIMEILQTFWDSENRVYKKTFQNKESKTISHILELIVYATT